MDVRFYFDSLSLASWARIHDVIGALAVFFYFPQGSLLVLLLFCSIFFIRASVYIAWVRSHHGRTGIELAKQELM